MMRAQVIGQIDREPVGMPWSLRRRLRRTGWMIGVGEAMNGVGEAVSAAVQWIGEHADEIGTWLSENGEQVAGWAQDAADLFGIGPSYDSENGGEVRRQLEANGWHSDRWAQSYMNWLENYRPDVWQSGDIWDAGSAAPTPWKTVYTQYIDLGLPEGFLMDANMVPVGLAAASQAILELEAAGLGTGSTVNPGGGNGSGGGFTIPDNWVAPRPGGGSGAGAGDSSNLITYGAIGLGLLFLLSAKR